MNFVGVINSIQFSYVLSEFLKLTSEEVEKLMKEMEIGGSNKIKYYEFMNLVYAKSNKVSNS